MRVDAAEYSLGKLTLTTSDHEAIRFAIGFRPGEYKIVQDQKKRSLNANSLYWSVLTKMAKTIGVSNPMLHNLMLRRYGQVEIYGGRTVFVVIPDTDEAQKQVD